MIASEFTFENLYRAWRSCRFSKRRSRSAMEFEVDSEKNLLELTRELQERTWHPSPSSCFIAKNDKYREVFAAEFRDRVVHHFLVPRLEDIWEPVFIHDSYACRKGKGTHAAVQRLRSFLNKVTRNGTRRAYFLQLDIRSFFPSINRKILLDILLARIESPELRWLTEVIVKQDPTLNPVMKCSRKKWRKISPDKSLFTVPDGQGLPIGNLTSQFFANVYLNSLDQFAKHTLKSKYYIRYVDDFVLFHHDREVLLSWQNQIETFLHDSLGLQLHPNRRVLKPVSCGINFLGYVTHRTHVLVRKRTINRFREKIEKTISETYTIHDKRMLVNLNPFVYMKCYSTVSSYLGIFSHADSFDFVRAVFLRYFFLSLLFTKDQFRVTKRLCVPNRFKSIRQQHRFYHSIFDGVVIMQVGCYLEGYGGDAEFLAKTLGYRYAKPFYRFTYRCGTHISNISNLLLSLKHFQIMIVLQTDFYAGKSMARQPVYLSLTGSACINFQTA